MELVEEYIFPTSIDSLLVTEMICRIQCKEGKNVDIFLENDNSG